MSWLIHQPSDSVHSVERRQTTGHVWRETVPSCVALLPPGNRQTKQATGWRVSQHVNEDVAVLGQVVEVGGKIRHGSVAGLPVQALSCDVGRLRQSQDDAEECRTQVRGRRGPVCRFLPVPAEAAIRRH
jgi:hypothetical protein